MGPPGLWAELRKLNAGKTIHGAEVERLLQGKTVAVDGAVWLYEAQTQADVVQAYGAEGAAIKVTFERCVRWLRKGVLPVIVLEGAGGGRAERTFSRGHGALGSAFLPQARIRKLLASLGVPCVDAEGEAEATCAALAAAGECDFVATTDFDALLFGAPRVLRGLQLLNGVASKCEVWDAAVIESVTGLNRRALVAASFLAGCDYDCRSQTQTTSRDGQGVRGVGARMALQIARTLGHEGGGDALEALSGVVLDKVIPDTLNTTGPSVGKRKGGPARKLHRAMSLIAEEPGCREGFAAAVHQYSRVVSGAMTVHPGDRPFAWKGIDSDAEVMLRLQLSAVFPNQVCEKLVPLHLEWSLRVVAAECPAAARRDPVKRRNWAASRGLRYVPLSAKKPNRRKSMGVPYVLVEFALASGAAGLVRLEAGKKHARVSLVQSCGLLCASTRKSRQASDNPKQQRSLKEMFNSCAPETQSSPSTRQTQKIACQKPSTPCKGSGRQLRLSLFRRKSAHGLKNSVDRLGSERQHASGDSITAQRQSLRTFQEEVSADEASRFAPTLGLASALDTAALSTPGDASESKATSINKLASGPTRDTTISNVAEFFSRSWLPPKNISSCRGNPDECNASCDSQLSRKGVHRVIVETLPCTSTVTQTEDVKLLNAAPNTPHATSRRSQLAVTPQKRRRHFESMGGFCCPEDDETFAENVSSVSAETIDRTHSHCRGHPGLPETSMLTKAAKSSPQSHVRHAPAKACDNGAALNPAEQRKQARHDTFSHFDMVATPPKLAVMDVMEIDAVDTEDDLPLNLLMRRYAGS